MRPSVKFMAAFLAGLALMAAAPGAAAFEVVGLATPDSFIVDEATGNYYISNIKGRPLVKNNGGFITLLKPDGQMEKLKFIEGGKQGVTLHAPKGLLIIGDTLYAADIDHVRAFDKTTGALKADIDFTPLKAKYLNDVAKGPGGRVFVSDTVGNTVYSIDIEHGNKVEVFATGKNLESPTGLIYSPKLEKFFVTLGRGMVGTLDTGGKLEKFAVFPSRGLVGIDLDDEGNLFVSSFTRGIIYRIGPDAKPKVLAHGISAPADISLDKKKRLVLVPLFLRGRALTIAY